MAVNEVPPNPTQLRGALGDGLEALDLNQSITFQGYTRTVLPLDGFVFWIPSVPITVTGSLHYSQEITQNEDELYGSMTVAFASQDQVAYFRQAPVDTIYVATLGTTRFAFAQQNGHYVQAGLWTYLGRSIAPAMLTQLLDPPRTIDPAQAVVSNSLPLWLALNNYVCPYYDGFSNTLPLYPSFLTPTNLAPPYATVHIGDTDTDALQAMPYLTPTRSSYQNCTDSVRVTIYGLQNNAGIDFLNCVLQYSLDTGRFGIMNIPTVRDAKRTQAEIETLAMKKVINFKVNYNQSRVAAVSRQYIESAVPSIYLATSVTNPTYILAQQAPA